ncbi:phosphate signaling complex protein PhoU [Acetohalobium arabaticum]|uniref:Phosphate-specific transport system accessory protein PhoU n=1 Tax=Acetohalobium arabaticum (strain ATCC 49924 / DSM 5501 / Z-7288) TaxID=574087 RepID=D9QVZ1_ACEAZ|nr:phosphate signaling complex protein PhoU [Acetohalobium arabaticum]ADL12400.1 phosphate uptake regulator, PhoU [Acetohalobium arabaticum DSM 5501]
MVRSNFNQELEELNQKLLKMGSMVEEAIHKSVTSLAEKDVELAEEVMENDDLIDEAEVEIEKRCIKLIALQQPVAKDLRTIGMISKIITDLERMGDLAYNIARITTEIAGESLIKPLVDIPHMTRITQDMVRESLDAFVNLDSEKAYEVAEMDDEVDRINEQILRELLTYMMEDASTISQATRLMFVGRYLERIADHATNICERIIYMVTGEREEL